MPIPSRTLAAAALMLASGSQMSYAGSALDSEHLKNAAPGHVCGTDDNKQDWRQLQKLNKLQLQDKTSFASKVMNKLSTKKPLAPSVAGNGVAGRYYIPVVVHVYGSRYNCTNASGLCLTDQKIIDGLNKSNEDFLGTNTQDGPISPEFQAIRENLNVEFVLAQKDPSGNATNGIVRHNREQAGYGDGESHDSQIAADAWDNFKYMNVYIMQDLYADGSTNNSGVAWYPQMSMSQAGLSRVVYNGDYVGANTNENFRSVLTHEFGHWLNLPHVFDGDVCSVHQEAFCAATGDNVCDTPQMSSSILQDNAPNCLGRPTNTENFMHYSDNYAMYTQQQVSRMTAALHGPARATLWSNSNLIATGLDQYTSNADHPWDGSGVDVGPQGTLITEFDNLSAAKGESDNYMVDVPQGSEAVAFYLDGYTEDPDLYVSKGTAPTKNGTDWVADYISFKSTGTPELVTITSPSSTQTYHATVDAFSAYTNARLQVLDVEDPTLCSGCERVFLLEQTGLASAKGATPKTYSFNVPSDAQKTVVVLPGGYEGDPDLYVSVNATPTTDQADCKPFSAPRLSEYCELPAGGGTVNIMIDPFLEYSGTTIRVYYERSSSNGSNPTANANGPYTAALGNAITFSSNGSTDSDGTIVSYLWDFGDGTTSTDTNPSHTYANADSYTVTLTVTDNSGLTGVNTAAVSVTNLPPPAFCSVTGNTGYEWIAQVATEGFTHSSGKDGYKDNTALVMPLVEGANTLTLTPGGTYTEHWSAYIDLNEDGVFDEASEKLITGVSGKGAVTATLTVPAGHVGKQYRLRVIMKYGSEAASACGSIGDGEAEDYTVSISEGNGGGGGNSSVPDACATQAPITSGRLEAGEPACLGESSAIWLSIADVASHQSIAISTGNGTGNLDVLYKNGGWPSDSDFDGQSNGNSNTECIYLTGATNYWSYFKITGNASGATIVVDYDTAGCRQ